MIIPFNKEENGGSEKPRSQLMNNAAVLVTVLLLSAIIFISQTSKLRFLEAINHAQATLQIINNISLLTP